MKILLVTLDLRSSSVDSKALFEALKKQMVALHEANMADLYKQNA